VGDKRKTALPIFREKRPLGKCFDTIILADREREIKEIISGNDIGRVQHGEKRSTEKT
jgi:hypothetical protein